MTNKDRNNSGEDAEGRLDALERRFRELEDRLERLEQKLDALQRGMSAETQRKSDEKVTGRSPSRPSTPYEEAPSAEEQRTPASSPRSSSRGATADSSPAWSFLERSGWLNKLGAVLLIVGLLLLFKYSVERGWVTPGVRLATGGVLSVGLLIWGLLTSPDQSRFRQVALGGGLAGLFITGFASYYLYQYFSFGASWAYMLAVTAGALYLSLREDEPVLAVLGVVGGLATPFLLYRQDDQFIELILYTCLILTLCGAIYFYRRWVSLMWTTFIGGLAVFGVILAYGIFGESVVPSVRRWTLQGGLLLFLGLLWPLPMLRSWLSLRSPKSWGPVRSPALYVHLPLVVLVLPVCGYLFTIWTWGWSVTQSGIIGLGASAVMGGLYLMMTEAFGRNLKQVHLYSGFLLMLISFWLLFGGNHLYAWHAGQMLLMHGAAYATRDERLVKVTHLMALFIGLHVTGLMVEPNLLTVTGANLAEIVTVASFGGSAWLMHGRGRESIAYSLFTLVLFLGWIANLFWSVENGQVLITVIWGVIALLILGIGYRRPLRLARYTGAGVLLLTLAKLVFFDLSHLGTLWRILLFLGFGIVLLVTGYLLSRKGRR